MGGAGGVFMPTTAPGEPREGKRIPTEGGWNYVLGFPISPSLTSRARAAGILGFQVRTSFFSWEGGKGERISHPKSIILQNPSRATFSPPPSPSLNLLLRWLSLWK